MTNGKKIIAAVVAPLVLGGFLLVAQPAASRAEDSPAAPESRPAYGMGLKMGFRGGMLSSLSELLGIDLDTLRAERQAGKSIADIAAEKGIDKESLVDAIKAERQQMIEEKVAAGQMTREQADFCLQNMEQRISQKIERTATGPSDNGQVRRGCRAGSADGKGQGQGIRDRARDGSGTGCALN